MHRVAGWLQDNKYVVAGITLTAAIGCGGFYCYKRYSMKDKHCVPVSQISPDDESSVEIDDPVRLKNLGNKHYKAGNYEKAIHYYTKGIAVCPEGDTENMAVLLQNRAASHDMQKDFDSALEDINAALKTHPKYIRALSRRSKLYELRKMYPEALIDATASCILDSFKTMSTIERAERLSKLIGQQKFDEMKDTLAFSLPNDYNLQSYFSCFTCDPILSNVVAFRSLIADSKHTDYSTNGSDASCEGNGVAYGPFNSDLADIPADSSLRHLFQCKKIEGGLLFLQAVEALFAKDYATSFEHIKRSHSIVDTNCNTSNQVVGLKVYVKLLYGAYAFVSGDLKTCSCLFDFILNGAGFTVADRYVKVSTLIRKASIFLEAGNKTDGRAAYDQAEELLPTCADIFFHRSQSSLYDDIRAAFDDIKRAAELAPNVSFTQRHFAFAQIRCAQLQSYSEYIEKLRGFSRIVERFPQCVETKFLYSAILLEQQKYDEADEQLVAATKLEPSFGICYARRAVILLAKNQFSQEALNLLQEAIRLDPKCQLSKETLASFYLQSGELSKALDVVEMIISAASYQSELLPYLAMREVVQAQIAVAERYNISAEQFAELARVTAENMQMA